MKKLISLLLAVLLLFGSALAEISTETLDGLTEADRTILLFNVNTAIARKENGDDSEKYSYHLNLDLMDLPLEELYWLFDYLHGETDEAYTGPQEETPLTRHGITVTPSAEVFKDDTRLTFCLYSTIAETCRALENVTQVNNPEIVFDADSQTLSNLRLYMNCYAEGSNDFLRPVVEDYTDTLIAALLETYPGLTFSAIMVNWKIPAINADSLYSASYWCEPENGVMLRGAGTGALYK